MWALDNLTAYTGERNWLRDKDGCHHWLVAVKATFDIGPRGELQPAEDQPAPLLEPIFRDDPAASSLLQDADLLAIKPGTDVVLDACAFAPRGRPADTVDVSLVVERHVKTLRVWGARTYKRGLLNLTTSAPQPFTVQPIHYEWAFGGADLSNPDPDKQRMDPRNPVGRGVATEMANLVDQPAHVIEYLQGDTPRTGPSGFGPIASHWSPRRERAGTYGKQWEQNKRPLLPDDYDARFGSCAPDDQWSSRALMGGEWIRLLNMTPEGDLAFQVPPTPLSFETVFRDRAVQHDAHLATVFIVPHARRVSLTWQSSLMVPVREVDYLDYTVIDEVE